MVGEMSTVSENPKPIKHLQHEKLRREEDEEQWISGEELCTEGSSDEDASKPSHRCKPKRRTQPYHSRAKKSPCLPPKQPESENPDSAKQDSESRSDECDMPIQWRPKRGSIKLPDLSDEARPLRSRPVNPDEFDSVFKQLHSCKGIDLSDPRVRRNFLEVLELDGEIKRTEELLKAERDERLSIQREVCSVLQSEDLFPSELRTSRMFLQMCIFDIENPSEDNEEKENNPVYKSKRTEAYRKFISRNIKLAKHWNVMSSPLTDEDKEKLARLLIDIDAYSDDEIPTDNSKENDVLKIVKDDKLNGFLFIDEDQSQMEEIDSKLTELKEERDNESSVEDREERLFDNRQRDWKEQLLLQRLQAIDKELADLKSQETGELTKRTESEGNVTGLSSESSSDLSDSS